MHELAQMAYDASEGEFDLLVMEIELTEEATGGSIWQETDGQKKYLSLDMVAVDVHELSLELQTEMKKHTGGHLVGIRLTFDKDGEARAGFKYAEEHNNET